jgi:hypothetical protein
MMKTQYMMPLLLTLALVLGLGFTVACDYGGGVDGDGGVDGAADADEGMDADTATSACGAAGGTCTDSRWNLCPVGTEPIDPDPHQDCGSGTGTDGWCCVDAPASTCSDAAGVNCVVGTECIGCWGPAENTSLTCEAGRVCCTDICD